MRSGYRIQKAAVIGSLALTLLIGGLPPTYGESEFPQSIEHSFGKTVIEKQPERVAVLGTTDHDIVLALGMTLVMVHRWIPQWSKGVGPWAEPFLKGAPPLVSPTREINLEMIASSEPDIIIGSGTMLDRSTFDKLTQLAPTLAPSTEYPDAYAAPWQFETLFVGRALGREAEAKAAVARVDNLFDTARRKHPDWKNKTAATIINWNGQILMYSFSDNRGQFMKALGFDMPAELKSLTGNRFNVPLSEERLDLLNELDILIVLTNSSAGRAFFERSPVFSQLNPVKNGHVVYLDDLNLTMAMSASTVLSIPYVFDALTHRIEQALEE